MPDNKLHYGWLVAGSGTLCILACLGFGRFALGMLLPSMGADLGLTYSQMGFISTGNFVGYLASVLLSGYLSARIGPSRVIVLSLCIVGASMILIGQASGFALLLVLYTITGVGSGGANIPMMGLVSAWFTRALRGRAAGMIVIGSGFAIIISGKIIPMVNASAGVGGWRINWSWIGIAVLLIALVCRMVLRDSPASLGLSPVGHAGAPARDMSAQSPSYRRRVMTHLGAIYFLFGYTYVIYATFIVTSLVEDHGMSEMGAGGLWMAIGALSLLSGPVFGTLSDRLGRGAGFFAVFLLHTTSYLLAALSKTPALLYLSVGAFGLAAWSIPGIMAAAVGDYFGAKRAPQAFGLITFVFALGQISGPAVAGVLAERTGSFSSSFMMAAVAAALAAILSLALKPPAQS